MKWWVVLIAACSTPATKQDPVHPPPDDEDKSVAWQAAHPKPDARPIDPNAPTQPLWTFEWERYRKSYDELMATTPGSKPCDWRVHKTRAQGEPECLPHGRPLWHAANVKHAVGRGGRTTELELDIGDRDKLTTAWWGALIDDTGLPITEWAHPFNIGKYDSYLLVNIPYSDVGRKTRVALVKEKP